MDQTFAEDNIFIIHIIYIEIIERNVSKLNSNVFGIFVRNME